MTAYASTLCADGYKGRLCSECAPGYGATAIATCRKCPSFAKNTVFYILSTLLTLALLANAMHFSVQEAIKLQLEFDEAALEAHKAQEELAKAEEGEHGEEEEEEGRGEGAVEQQKEEAEGVKEEGKETRSLGQHAQQAQQRHVVNSMMQSDTPCNAGDMNGEGLANSMIAPTNLGSATPLRSSQKPPTPPHTANSMLRDRPTTLRVPKTASSMARPSATMQSPPPTANTMHREDVTLPTAPAPTSNTMVRGDPVLEPGGVCMPLQEPTQNPQRSHFYDHRDPILEDAQQALNVIIRIFVSYIQVWDGCTLGGLFLHGKVLLAVVLHVLNIATSASAKHLMGLRQSSSVLYMYIYIHFVHVRNVYMYAADVCKNIYGVLNDKQDQKA